MACNVYNPRASYCGKVPCDNAYDCQRVVALKEMSATVQQRPSIENMFDSLILFEGETIDLNEMKRMAIR